MTTPIKIELSDKTFWDWVQKHIKNDVNLFEGMIDIERYVTGQNFRNDSESKSSIFYDLKKAIPPDYFCEMEYCALAYSTIFGTVFPPLTQHIEQLAYIEWLNYVEPEKENYRDHFVHMLKVAFVCDEIFDKVLRDDIVCGQFASPHFKRWCKNERIDFNESNKENIVEMSIFLAAIFHDFGYGYKFIRNYEKKLFKLNLLGCDSVDITKSRGEIIKKSLLAEFILEHHAWYKQGFYRQWYKQKKDDISEEQKENIVLGFIRDCLPLNHSVASALAVLDIGEDLYRSHIINPDLYVAFQIAAEACCLHDMTGFKEYLHLETSSDKHNHFLDCNCYDKIPVSMLLILADELSMWNRPKIKYESGKNGYERIAKLHHYWKKGQDYPTEIELQFLEKELKISLGTIDTIKQNEIFKEKLSKLSVFGEAGEKDILSVFNHEINFVVN